MLILILALCYLMDLLLKAAIFSIAVLAFPKIIKSKAVRVLVVTGLFLLADFIHWFLAGQLQLSITTANEEVAKFFGGNDLTSAFLEGPSPWEVVIYAVIASVAVHFMEKLKHRFGF